VECSKARTRLTAKTLAVSGKNFAGEESKNWSDSCEMSQWPSRAVILLLPKGNKVAIVYSTLHYDCIQGYYKDEPIYYDEVQNLLTSKRLLKRVDEHEESNQLIGKIFDPPRVGKSVLDILVEKQSPGLRKIMTRDWDDIKREISNHQKRDAAMSYMMKKNDGETFLAE
jgi:hypothetical protein